VVGAPPNAAAYDAGIRLDDILTGWSAAGESEVRPFDSPFDLIELERERQPVEPVVLHGEHDGRPYSYPIGEGRWRLRTRPDWGDGFEATHADLHRLQSEETFETLLESLQAFAGNLHEAGRVADAVWVIADFAGATGQSGDWTGAGELFGLVVEALADGGNDPMRAYAAYEYGVALMRQSRFGDAAAAFERARDLHLAISPERLGVAAALIGMGRIAERQSDFETARKLLEGGLALQERLAPESLLVASTLNELGRMASSRARLAEAESYFQRALDIAEARKPGGSEVGGYLNSLAIAAYLQGDVAGADEKWQRSLAIKEVFEPDSSNVAAVLGNIGLVKIRRGDYLEAERYYRRALEMHQRRDPGSLATLRTISNLGMLALEQGDLEAAEAHYRTVYDVMQAEAPDSLDFAAALVNLGTIARHRGDFDLAEQHLRAALDIQSRHAPEDRRQGTIFLNLGVVAERQDRLDAALQNYRLGREVFRQIAPSGPGAGEALLRLGNFVLAHDEADGALPYFEEALGIFEVIAPRSYPEAEALHGIARVYWRQGDAAVARAHFQRAVDALDSQHNRLGGTEETKATVRARYVAVYKDFIDFLLEQGDEEAAFDILERSRSKVLSELLAERDLVFGVDLPAGLERRRRMLAYNYESLQGRLYDTGDADQIDALHEEMAAIRREQAELRSDIRAYSPRLADLKYPEPVTLARAVALLPQGTAVISYSVGADDTDIFVLTDDRRLVVRTVPVSSQSIEDLVTRYRLLLDAGRFDAQPDENLSSLAATIYSELVLPVEADVAPAERLLVVPDGSLNVLPFAALRRKQADGGFQYVAEWKPSLVSNSLTIYSQLVVPTRDTDLETLVAFGGPDYSGSAAAADDSSVRSGGLRSALSELPWAREEVENIGHLYEARATVFTGPDATEERAKAATGHSRYVHFATHALLNQQLPLDSSIALTIPGAEGDRVDNGLLQVWEIYETMRLDAELVTLSGCETALGTAYAGEGLIGLTRAFQYAGASSVLASLWSVNDRSTSRLMTLFYQNLAAGQPQEVALQRAQVAMIRGERDDRSWLDVVRGWFGADDAEVLSGSHPYRWAGFVLNGLGG